MAKGTHYVRVTMAIASGDDEVVHAKMRRLEAELRRVFSKLDISVCQSTGEVYSIKGITKLQRMDVELFIGGWNACMRIS